PQRPEPRSRSLRRRRWNEAGVARSSRMSPFSLEQRLERPAPARGKRRDSKHAPELLSGMMRGVQERAHLGDRHRFRSAGDFLDRVTRADIALLEHPEVEAGASAAGQERSHPRLIGANPDAVAGGPGLRDLEEAGADPEAVADAYLVVRQ